MTDTLGKRIKYARERLRLTQGDLGKRVGIQPQSVSQWESGIKAPSRENLKAVASILSISLQWLVYGGPLPERHENDTLVPQPQMRARPMLSVADAAAKRQPDMQAPRYVAHSDCSESSYWATLPDGSNAPDFPADSMALFDPDARSKPGNMVLAVWGGGEPIIGEMSIEASPKGRVTIVTPRNPRWPAVRSDQDQIEIIAVMIEHVRILKA